MVNYEFVMDLIKCSENVGIFYKIISEFIVDCMIVDWFDVFIKIDVLFVLVNDIVLLINDFYLVL